MLYNLDSSKYARSFDQNPTLPWSKVTPVAGLNLLAVKVSDSSNFFLGILLSEFRFTLFFPGAVKWIHISPAAICRQPIIFHKHWRFSKKKHQWKSPRAWRVVKFQEFEGTIRWNELCPFHQITGLILTLLEKVPRTQKSEKKFQDSGLFPPTNLVLRPA